METLRLELARLLEIPASDLRDDTVLRNVENWDSLAQVSLVAYVVSEGGQQVDVRAMASATTFADLARVLQS